MRRRTLVRDRQTAFEIAVEGHYYLYPLVLMDVTRRQATGVGTANELFARAPVNEFAHIRRFVPPGFRDVVRPNFDTLYSFAWLDVSEEPVIVSIGDAGDHYYTLPMYDMWSDVFAAPGTRTSGNWPGEYAVVPYGWQGTLPEATRRLDAPTPYVWIIGRMQCDGEIDYPSVHRFQDRLGLSPLSSYGREPRQRSRPLPDVCAVDPGTPPPEQVEQMDPLEFFSYAAELLKVHPPHATDHAVLQRLERLGLVAGESLDLEAMPRSVVDCLSAAVAESRLMLYERSRQLGWSRNGWWMNTETMGAWGTDYLKRAAVDRIGLSATLPEDILYPTTFTDDCDRPLHGGSRYAMRFEPHELPPVRASWSLMAYDDDGYLVPNEAGRYAIRARDRLELGRGGSLELTIQADEPAGRPAANWLPCPREGFSLSLRLYWPRREALDRSWSPPPVRRLDAAAA
jgi:hypothetical protein